VLEDPGLTKTTATKDEMMAAFRQMYTIRRMEISCDTEVRTQPPLPLRGSGEAAS
jgi:TPP-dependent pyruvate/acetoin dehydrogenase alpha subunit